MGTCGCNSGKANRRSYSRPHICGILADQFKRLKIGDRFYFENTKQFRTEELSRIYDVTFSHLICWTLDIEEVARNSFIADGDKVKCSDLPTLMEVLTPAFG